MSNQIFLDVSEIIKAMRTDIVITNLVGDRIFDGIPDFTDFGGVINENYIILEVAGQPVIEECTKSTRLSVRIVAGKRSVQLKELRNIYSVIRSFLVSNTKTFGTFKTWSVSEGGYLEPDDSDGKRTILNSYRISYLYDN